VALYSKVMLVALPSTPGPEALLSPVAGLVCRVLVFADQDFSLGEMHRTCFALPSIYRVAQESDMIECVSRRRFSDASVAR
jgi:hypothetical protein